MKTNAAFFQESIEHIFSRDGGIQEKNYDINIHVK